MGLVYADLELINADDIANVVPNNAAEIWDVIQGVTILQLYNAHGSNITNMCSYRQNFATQNPNLNQVGVNAIFDNHRAFCR